jgi:hypothetical protein
MAVYHGEIYVGGKFLNAGGSTATRIAKWNGTSWSPVGTGVGMDDVVRSLAVDSANDVLYAAGDFQSVDGITTHNIAKWNGTSWSALTSSNLGSIETICMYNGNLYAGGNFIGGSCPNFSMWNGTAWVNPGPGFGAVGNVHTLYVYNSLLYIGGDISQIGNVMANFIGTWDGTNYAALGYGLATPTPSGSGAGVKAIINYNSKMYAGGEFLNSNGSQAKYIASWNGTSWDSVGTGMNNIVWAFCEYNSELYAAGQITVADGASVFYIAKMGGGTTGVKDFANNEITLYPNPTNGLVNIEVAGTASVEVYNAVGQKVFAMPAIPETGQLDLSGLPKGVYSVRINTKDNVYTRKTVIQN